MPVSDLDRPGASLQSVESKAGGHAALQARAEITAASADGQVPAAERPKLS